MNYRFNLQPWRQVEREKKKKNFVLFTGLLFLAAVAVVGFNYYIEQNYIEEQSETINYLKTEISQLESTKKQVDDTKELITEINKQIQSIENLQARRGTALRILDYLANETPASVFIDHLKFDGNQLTIEGIAENDSGVADFMRILQSNELLSVAVLRGIQAAESSDRYMVSGNSETKSFIVTADLKVLHSGEVDENR